MQKAYRNIAYATLFVLLTACAALNSGTAGATEQGDPNVNGKYAKYIFQDLKPLDIPPETLAKIKQEQEEQQSMVDATHLLNLDTTRSEGAPYLDFVWLWEGSAKGYAEAEHTHDFDEFIGFIGVADQDDPYDLDSEIELWLGGEKYMITRSCLIYVPKRTRHCPIRFTRIGKPVLFFTGGIATSYSRTATEFTDEHSAERNYENLISYGVNPDKISPETLKKWDDEGKKRQSTVEGTRLLDLDSVEGAPYIDFVYLWKGDEKGPNHPEHAHDWGEVFGFIGTNRDDVYDLGGEIEFWLGGEKYLFTKSSLVWVPPSLKHCPIQFNRIDRPFILFTFGLTRKYSLMPSADERKTD
jgi:mannose-6-phosphate isomerase-like protein (cupin superfamily)